MWGILPQYIAGHLEQQYFPDCLAGQAAKDKLVVFPDYMVRV